MLVLKDIWQCHIESISSVSRLFSYFCLKTIQVLKLCNIFWVCQEALALFMCETIQYCHLRRSVLYVCVWRCNRQLNGWSIPFSRFIVFQSWGYTLFLPYYKENETQETMSPHCLETLYINIWIAFTYREALNHALIHMHINRDTHWLKHKHGQNEKLQLFNNKYLKYIK